MCPQYDGLDSSKSKGLLRHFQCQIVPLRFHSLLCVRFSERILWNFFDLVQVNNKLMPHSCLSHVWISALHCKISKAEFLRAGMPSCHVIGWRCPFDCAATRAQACCHSCELPMHDNKEVNLGRPMLSSTHQWKRLNVCALPKPNLAL
jgi:hypothetical protein